MGEVTHLGARRGPERLVMNVFSPQKDLDDGPLSDDLVRFLRGDNPAHGNAQPEPMFCAICGKMFGIAPAGLIPQDVDVYHLCPAHDDDEKMRWMEEKSDE